MTQQLTSREHNGVTVVDATGALTFGAGTRAIRQTMWELRRSAARQVVLNFQAVTDLDSSAVGELVAVYTTITAGGGQVRLVLGRRVHDILVVTKLQTIFETFDDVDRAVASFKDTGPPQIRNRYPSELSVG